MASIENSSLIYVVATPIGNLDDITPRALKILKEADIIACEDTRVTKKLLSHFNIQSKDFVTYADHDEQEKADQLIKRLSTQNLILALVSDAGTPGISDPGYRLVHLARKHQIPVYPIPGACAPVALASVSGLPSDRFMFVGFLPNKEHAKIAEIESWSRVKASILFLESARRIDKTLRTIADIYPHAMVCIGRELTKLYEETFTLNVSEAAQWVSTREALRGEVTVMLHIPSEANKAQLVQQSTEEIMKDAKRAFKSGQTLKDLLVAYKDLGLSRSELYQLLLKAKNEE